MFSLCTSRIVSLAFLDFHSKNLKNTFQIIDTGLKISQASKKHMESSSGHTLSFYLVKYRLKNMFLKGAFIRFSTDSSELKGNRLRRRKYDLVFIEKTIGLVFGTSTVLHRSFPKHCILTNKVVGTIWRELSKSLQRRQGPDPRPLWLLVGTPLVLGPEFASRRAEHSLHRGCLCIFLIFCCYPLTCLCNNFYYLSSLVGLLVLGLYNKDYLHFLLNVCPFGYTAFTINGKARIP